MIKVYAVVLAVGMVGLVILLMGGVLADNVGRPDLDPDRRLGSWAAPAVGAAVGFGMGGMSAEFAPIDIPWQVALVIALAAAGLSVVWVRYAVGRTGAG
ncbi:MAG: hypothetical protein PVG83_08960 [Acidimicrobiia bacterium]|jgi:hypothetical protein